MILSPDTSAAPTESAGDVVYELNCDHSINITSASSPVIISVQFPSNITVATFQFTKVSDTFTLDTTSSGFGNDGNVRESFDDLEVSITNNILTIPLSSVESLSDANQIVLNSTGSDPYDFTISLNCALHAQKAAGFINYISTFGAFQKSI